VCDLSRCIRELQFHPEQFVDSASSTDPINGKPVADWIAQKERWINTVPTPQNSRERCQAIRQANEALQPAVADLRESWSAANVKRDQQQRSAALLASREYADVLFPEVILTNFLLPILENSAATG
jgi:hypothetical protein